MVRVLRVILWPVRIAWYAFVLALCLLGAGVALLLKPGAVEEPEEEEPEATEEQTTAPFSRRCDCVEASFAKIAFKPILPFHKRAD